MTLSDQLAAYLTRVHGRPTVVEGLSRISGGASRETYRYDAVTDGERRGFILRRDPPGSLIETDRRLEFLAIRSFAGKGVAAPEAIVLEEAGAELERPFFIMGRVDGGVAGSPFAADPYGEHAQAIGQQIFSHLGRIAGEPLAGLPILEAAAAPAPEDCWRSELDYGAGVITADEAHPQCMPPFAAFAGPRRRRPARSPWSTATFAPATSFMMGRAKSSPCWIGKWPTWAIPWKTWAGP
jgi:aminoglycoside phosphotransferase (APT) family kinase protein